MVQRRGRVIALAILEPALEGGRWSAARPGHFTPEKDTPLYRTLLGSQGRSGRLRKISSLLGFDPRAVQPVALYRCYTD